jgi:tripartite-type tricarboxylate transporter receptor subunit TctC
MTHKLSRRTLLVTGASGAAALAAPAAFAQGAWPSKPVTIVVPFPPGGGTDAFARPLFAVMTKNTGRQFVIDNKGGAGGTLGAGIAAKAAADGQDAARTARLPAQEPRQAELRFGRQRHLAPSRG